MDRGGAVAAVAVAVPRSRSERLLQKKADECGKCCWQWQIAGGRLQVADCRWQIAGGRLQVADCRWQIAGGKGNQGQDRGRQASRQADEQAGR